MKTHTFTTVPEAQRVYPGRSCSLTFTPVGTAKDGVHIAVAGMTQYLVYGLWDGECQLDG